MSDQYQQGAHDTVTALITMFKNIKAAPIIGAARYLTKVHEVAGEPYISIDNMIMLLEHHRDKTTTRIQDEKHGKRLRITEDT